MVIKLTDVVLEDTAEIVADATIPWLELKNSAVLVTGATGLIGSAIVRTLSAANEKYSLDIQIIALGRNEEKGKILENYGAVFYRHDICAPFVFADNIDYIFHCAAVTGSPEWVKNPVGVTEISLKGLSNILALAREKRVKSIVYLSSKEVYGDTGHDPAPVTENEFGYIDIKNPRSCYPESKRMCECICNCWFSQYKTPVKIARLAQTFGAGSSIDDPRVFAQFAGSAAAGKDIILHTYGKSTGDYCYISDSVRGLFLLLLKGENGQAYNIVNPEASMTIREMAELIADEVCGGNISVVVNVPEDIEERGYAPDVTRRLSADKIMKLGWKPKYGLAQMYGRMLKNLEAAK